LFAIYYVLLLYMWHKERNKISTQQIITGYFKSAV